MKLLKSFNPFAWIFRRAPSQQELLRQARSLLVEQRMQLELAIIMKGSEIEGTTRQIKWLESNGGSTASLSTLMDSLER